MVKYLPAWAIYNFEVNILGEETGVMFGMELVSGWNLISIPLIPEDNSISSIMDGCDYNRIWEFQSDQSWKSTDTGLTTMDILHGYWVDRVGLSGNCTISITGTEPDVTEIPVTSTWTLAGFPSSMEQNLGPRHKHLPHTSTPHLHNRNL